MIRVFLIDQYPLVRSGVASILGRDPDLQVCGEADDTLEALPQIGELKPDVVVMDVFKTGAGGIGAIEKLREQYPEIKVIILTESSREVDFLKAVRAGAKGYLAKSLRPEAITNSIRLAAGGGTVIHSLIGSRLFSGLRGPESKGSSGELSPRERQILALVAVGNSNREIAARIFVSETTVKSYLRRILEKLEVKNRAQAVAIAIEKGLLDNYNVQAGA